MIERRNVIDVEFEWFIHMSYMWMRFIRCKVRSVDVGNRYVKNI